MSENDSGNNIWLKALMNKRTLLMSAVSGLLIITLVFISWYKVEQAKKNTIIAQLEVDRSCDLQQGDCSLTLPGGGSVTLSMAPRPIPLVQKFNIQVNTKGINVEAVAVDFKGTTMNMGPNNVTLSSLEKGVYSGIGMLPVCIRNSMEWQADVYLQGKEGITIAPFVFVTHK